MSLLNYNEITPRKFVELDGEPFEVITSQVSRKQANKPVNKTKVKSLLSGKVVEKVFHVSDKATQAEIDNRDLKYLYTNRGEYWFCDPDNPRDRFPLNAEVLAEKTQYLKENDVYSLMYFDEQPIRLKLPVKLDLVVAEAAPAVKGNTAQGATKTVTVETGATLNVPLFINEGDVIRINTDTGEYTERVEKQ